MGKQETQSSGLFGRPSIFDVGIGVLYFFTSHMVIRALYYVGIDRTPWELTVFFLTVVLAIIVAHGLAGPLLRGRLLVETSFGVPAVSVLAAVGTVVALVSVLPVVGVGFFYASGLFWDSPAGGSSSFGRRLSDPLAPIATHSMSIRLFWWLWRCTSCSAVQARFPRRWGKVFCLLCH